MQCNSNAVLTPELIHPNYFLEKKRINYTRLVRADLSEVLSPLSADEIEERKQWAKRQIEILKFNPSNAVLGI